MTNKYYSVCQRNSVAELTLRREWLTGHSCCQCRLAKQRDFTQFLRSGRALLQEACSEVQWQELWSEISGNHIGIILSCSVSQMWPVDSCLFSEFTDVFFVQPSLVSCVVQMSFRCLAVWGVLIPRHWGWCWSSRDFAYGKDGRQVFKHQETLKQAAGDSVVKACAWK